MRRTVRRVAGAEDAAEEEATEEASAQVAAAAADGITEATTEAAEEDGHGDEIAVDASAVSSMSGAVLISVSVTAVLRLGVATCLLGVFVSYPPPPRSARRLAATWLL